MELFNSSIQLKTITLSDVSSFISLLFVVIGGLFALIQWNKQQKIRRSEYIYSLIEKLRSDNRINYIFYQIDSEIPWYDKEKVFKNKDFEINLDKALSYYSYICYLRKKKIIKEDDFAFFKYEIDRASTNKDVICYFYNYYHFCKKRGLPNAYKYLFEYAVENHGIPNDFYDPKAYLNNNAYTHDIDF